MPGLSQIYQGLKKFAMYILKFVLLMPLKRMLIVRGHR